jgi:cytoskeletal protein RodZ
VVEIFVQENPDLKEEFSMMKLTINFPDEEVRLSDKSFLLKKESHFINENNYEKIFVLYHDNELPEEQEEQTQDFVAKNPKLKIDFELIGQAKLIPDNSVVYPGKKQLYRKEKSGKVIPMILWRSIAAAVFIGFGLWITISYFNKTEVSQLIATSTNNNIPKPTIKKTKPGTEIISKKPVKEENNIASSTKTTKPEIIKKNKTDGQKPVLKERKIKKESIAVNDIKTKKVPVEQKINVPMPNTDYQLAASDKPVKEMPAIIEKTETHLADNHITLPVNKIEADVHNEVHAQTVAYISGVDANNQNYVFYDMPAENFRKSKVGVFLKKVGRVVERNNPITRLFAEDNLVAR